MSSSTTDVPNIPEPIAIFKLAGRYLLYDVDTITCLRAKHNVMGVLTGQLPQAPQQNVFSGIPLELMPEEARLLCEKGVGYVVDDVKAHKQGFLDRGLSEEERKVFRETLRRQGQAAACRVEEKAMDKKKAALSKAGGNVGDWNDLPEDMLRPTSRASGKKGKKKGRSGTTTPPESIGGDPLDAAGSNINEHAANGDLDESESLFAQPSQVNTPPRRVPPAAQSTGPPLPTFHVTPTTSYPPLTAATPPPRSSTGSPSTPALELNDLGDPLDASVSELPEVPPSYPLFKHMHSRGYFQAPGIRFGCQYMAYPGDPLRFHSHFLCNGMDWDQEFDLLDLVGGGRLGTGVKKGYLIGGVEKKDGLDSTDEAESNGEGVRTFCVEWGGM
ncbi:tRNA-splicing endonuclease subunit [Recurvomyces mirabilis]|uniref:tRNA-intron lyase n=1 Tax=Recurvomyces mirabilis TaxID=574656 RepID=A0AAE0WTI7_9PEZI|nr:tRNA-splicing endonuclease subunit [Recurvomyces mirabilis]KAK5160414.1 tRNA-splicing endonuclease subunit [Recurvomyces mirabilis]